MADQTETYVKTTADGQTKERTVHTAQDRVAAKFAGYQPKTTKKPASAPAKSTGTTDAK